MTEIDSRRFIPLTRKEEVRKLANREAEAQAIIDRETQSKNCLECLFSEIESKNVSSEMIYRNTPDVVLGDICDEVRACEKCRNRVFFDQDPEFKRPHLSTLYAIEGIRRMCNNEKLT